MDEIVIGNKKFTLSVSSHEIQTAIRRLADSINKDFHGTEIYFIAILDGAFVFASELIKHISLSCKISFVKLKSYEGMKSTGNVQELIGLNEDMKDKTVIILEDIVDTGRTLQNVYEKIAGQHPLTVKVATMFFKRAAYRGNLTIDYAGLEIPNRFVVGFGLDYNGLGRNLTQLYVHDDN
jgi:hypoxanthine phosphoribosyltransferase